MLPLNVLTAAAEKVIAIRRSQRRDVAMENFNVLCSCKLFRGLFVF